NRVGLRAEQVAGVRIDIRRFRRRKDERKLRRSVIKRTIEVAAGRARGPGGRERAEDSGVGDAPVVESIAAAQNGVAGTGDVPGKAEARAEVVAVMGKECGLRNVRVNHKLVGIGQTFVVVTHAERKGKARRKLPVIGEKGGVVGSLKIPYGGTDTLAEPGVAGARARAGGGSIATRGREEIGDEVGKRGVGIFAVLVGDSVHGIGNMIVVVPEAEGVTVANPGDGVNELLAGFERVLGF